MKYTQEAKRTADFMRQHALEAWNRQTAEEAVHYCKAVKELERIKNTPARAAAIPHDIRADILKGGKIMEQVHALKKEADIMGMKLRRKSLTAEEFMTAYTQRKSDKSEIDDLMKEATSTTAPAMQYISTAYNNTREALNKVNMLELNIARMEAKNGIKLKREAEAIEAEAENRSRRQHGKKKKSCSIIMVDFTKRPEAQKPAQKPAQQNAPSYIFDDEGTFDDDRREDIEDIFRVEKWEEITEGVRIPHYRAVRVHKIYYNDKLTYVYTQKLYLMGDDGAQAAEKDPNGQDGHAVDKNGDKVTALTIVGIGSPILSYSRDEVKYEVKEEKKKDAQQKYKRRYKPTDAQIDAYRIDQNTRLYMKNALSGKYKGVNSVTLDIAIDTVINNYEGAINDAIRKAQVMTFTKRKEVKYTAEGSKKARQHEDEGSEEPLIVYRKESIISLMVDILEELKAHAKGRNNRANRAKITRIVTDAILCKYDTSTKRRGYTADHETDWRAVIFYNDADMIKMIIARLTGIYMATEGNTSKVERIVDEYKNGYNIFYQFHDTVFCTIIYDIPFNDIYFNNNAISILINIIKDADSIKAQAFKDAFKLAQTYIPPKTGKPFQTEAEARFNQYYKYLTEAQKKAYRSLPKQEHESIWVMSWKKRTETLNELAKRTA